jgi:hypothetical protein
VKKLTGPALYESKVLKALSGGATKSIRQLARACFPGVRPITKADSRVRNALRRPRATGVVKQVGPGTYASA